MAKSLAGIFGKFKPVKANKPSTYSMKPPPNPFGAYTPSKPAGGQGPVTQPVQPPTGPDESWKDSTYNTTTTGIQTGLQNLQGYLTNSGNELGADYGVQFDRNPNDPLQGSNFRIADNVDVTNPFSRAALLNRTHQQNVAGNTNSMAARGQLYSGALQNAQDSEGFGYLGGQNALKTDFAGKFGGLYKQWLDANQTGSQQGIDAQAAAIERHKNDPAADTGFATGGAAAPGTNTSQYADSSVGGKQPKESVSDAVKKYLAKQKKATNAGATYSMGKKKNGAGKTGGALAPGGK